MRKTSYRETEDLIRYYAPARFVCGLTGDGRSRREEPAFPGKL